MEQIFDDDGSLINLNTMEHLSDAGSEFTVYKYNDLVIKLYKDYYPYFHLSLDELNFLKKIKTQRILLPIGNIWNKNHKLVGYEMPFIAGNKNVQNEILQDFFNELEIIKQDIDILSNNLVLLFDVNLSNSIFNGHLYLVDPGNYLINKLHHVIYRINIQDSYLNEQIKNIIASGDDSKLKTLTDLLSIDEQIYFTKLWNYNKVNELIEMMLFSKRSDIDPYKFRQIVQFIIKEKKKNGFIYNLDIFKMFFDEKLTISDAIDDFICKNIKDNPQERKLFMSYYNK